MRWIWLTSCALAWDLLLAVDPLHKGDGEPPVHPISRPGAHGIARKPPQPLSTLTSLFSVETVKSAYRGAFRLPRGFFGALGKGNVNGLLAHFQQIVVIARHDALEVIIDLLLIDFGIALCP